MELAATESTTKGRFDILSLKRNRKKATTERKSAKRLSTIILDESFDNLKTSITSKRGDWRHISSSPIVINDSFDLREDDNIFRYKSPWPYREGKSTPTKGETNLDLSTTPQCKYLTVDLTDKSKPSQGGWSPAQDIICGSPKFIPTPSRSRDIANESLQECSFDKIKESHKNILDELYGDVWKTIPTLFKKKPHQREENLDFVAKKLNFVESKDSDKENSDIFNANVRNFYDEKSIECETPKPNLKTEVRTKKKLYTEKSFETPNTDIKKLVRKELRDLNTFTDHKTRPEKAKTERKNAEGQKVKRLLAENDEGDKVKRLLVENAEGQKVKRLLVENGEGDKVKRLLVENGEGDKVKRLLVEKAGGQKVKRQLENTEGKKVRRALIEPEKPLDVKKLSFMGSLADNVPTWRCEPEALMFKQSYKSKRDQLTRRLFLIFNKMIFGDGLENDMPIVWDGKLRSTAGTATNGLMKTSNLTKVRTSSVKLSSKVIDGPQRLRDTLVHELCHAATWVVDGELRAGHGPLWKKWAKRSLQVFPELEEISRCHDMIIHFKYTYKCTQCGYTVNRHSKSIDMTKKCCGYCRGTFELVVNRKTKDGVVVSTPAKQRGVNDFALYVKVNYAALKDGRTHAEVMKLLGERFKGRTTDGR